MATATNPASAPVIRTRTSPQTVGWVFMRVSGVALVFLALGHFAIQHVINDVHDLSLSFVEARWDLLAWRVWDALLLGLALIHGLNGLRVVVDDYVHRRTLNQVLRWVIVVVGGALLLIGVVTIILGVKMAPS